jgi:osmotically-inducible protein OsmY
MNRILKSIGSVAVVAVLSGGLLAQAGAARYDNDIQAQVTKRLADKKQFRNVQSAVDDGIVTLTGTVDLYQQKLDAAKRVRKAEHVDGVRNLIDVASSAPDRELAAKLDRKLHYDRIGYDNLFNYVTVSVDEGVVTLTGETMNDVGRDSALSLVRNTPGVNDVVDQIRVAPASNFDDRIRVAATRAIYNDPVLSRYGSDPAAPIRIVVSNGHLALYGTVENAMDKAIAGIRAGEVFGVFSVQNNLQVATAQRS